MNLKPEDINEFKAIWLKEYGEELTSSRAEEIGQSLINLVAIIKHYDEKDSRTGNS